MKYLLQSGETSKVPARNWVFLEVLIPRWDLFGQRTPVAPTNEARLAGQNWGGSVSR
jgi:hypothetical protein